MSDSYIIFGRDNCPSRCFEVYKEAKEKYIKKIVESYKEVLPTRYYEVMMNWEINIDD